MIKYIYLVEGETEEHLIKELKSKKKIISGKVEVWNVCQHSIRSIVRNLGLDSIVIIITDLDIHRNGTYNNYKLLAENLRILLLNSKKILLISQKDNLEEEIMRACSCNKKKLFNKFDVKTSSDFKREFLKCKNFFSVFNEFDIQKIWENNDDLLIKKLASYMAINKIEIDTSKIKI